MNRSPRMSGCSPGRIEPPRADHAMSLYRSSSKKLTFGSRSATSLVVRKLKLFDLGKKGAHQRGEQEKVFHSLQIFCRLDQLAAAP